MKFNDYLKNQLEDSEFKKEWDLLETQYEIKKELIKARSEQGLTQKELADKIGIPQSNISRLESGNYNPSIAFLQKIAKALGKKVHVKFM